MGTPEFAVPSLEVLLDNDFDVAAVVTVPDKPAGRGQLLHESAVKKFALSRGLKVLQPEKLKDPDFVNELRVLNADLQFVVAFRMLPEIVWNMPRLGTYNLHASLLPKYRGAAPINRAIMNGDHETGLTTFRLQHEIDTGNILFRKKVSIGSDTTAGELHDMLMQEGRELILRTALALQDHLRNGTALQFIPQDDTAATHAPKIFRDDCLLNWRLDASTLHNHVRGLSPYPAAFTNLVAADGNRKTFKIYRSLPLETEHGTRPGTLHAEGGDRLSVQCGRGSLQLLEVQLEGKKKMSVSEFLRGMRDLATCHAE